MGCTCSTYNRQVYVGFIVFHIQTVNGASFGFGFIVAVVMFLFIEYCCPNLVSAMLKNCCTRVRQRRADMTPRMCPIYIPSAPKGATLEQPSENGTLCINPKYEGMYGEQEYSFNGRRPTVYFSQTGQPDQWGNFDDGMPTTTNKETLMTTCPRLNGTDSRSDQIRADQ